MLLLMAAALPALLGSHPAPPDCAALPAPRVDMRANVARATSSPWVNSNSSRFLRHAAQTFCIDAPGPLSALAAAEAFAYGVTALVKTGPDGVDAFGRMLTFLRTLPAGAYPGMANIGFVDDGSAPAGELMNLLARRNLLFRVVTAPDARLAVNVEKVAAEDPSRQAYDIRQRVGDDKRLLRLYGSEVVLGRLTGEGAHARLHLLNYAQRPVNGLRVRVLGRYSLAGVHVFGVPDAELTDFTATNDATEFTIPHTNEYAVIDLTSSP